MSERLTADEIATLKSLEIISVDKAIAEVEHLQAEVARRGENYRRAEEDVIRLTKLVAAKDAKLGECRAVLTDCFLFTSELSEVANGDRPRKYTAIIKPEEAKRILACLSDAAEHPPEAIT